MSEMGKSKPALLEIAETALSITPPRGTRPKGYALGWTRVSIYDNKRIMWTILYYNDRVRREIEEWPVGIYADFLRLAEWLEEDGLDLRIPHSRAMSGGLFELRCKGPEGIGRAFYCIQVGRQLVILHSIVKKSQASPEKDLKLARKRLKEVLA